MTEHTSHAHGVPNWVDMSSPDPQASKAFYTGLFGWEAEDQFDPEGTYIYTMFSIDGKSVAGLGGQAPGMEGMPPVWNTYISVDDADAIVRAVEEAGGKVMMPTMDIYESGRMAVFADPTGAVFSVWQAGEHIGAELTSVPGAYSWNELLDRDLEAAKEFYAKVFGWTYDVQDMPGGAYTVVEGDRGGSAGMMPMPDDMPDQVPNHWGVYFNVADIDAGIATVTELGGQVVFGPNDFPGVGKIATVHDPAGGSFSIMEPAEEMS